jgi:predicted protein tyrosine phosphatase
MRIRVVPKYRATAVAFEIKATHAISLLPPGEDAELQLPHGCAYLRLDMHDVVSGNAGDIPPSEKHVRQLAAFASGLKPDSSLLIHCQGGISRSTAAAIIVIAILTKDQGEAAVERLVREFMKANPQAAPNQKFLACAESELGLGFSLLGMVARARGEILFAPANARRS